MTALYVFAAGRANMRSRASLNAYVARLTRSHGSPCVRFGVLVEDCLAEMFVALSAQAFGAAPTSTPAKDSDSSSARMAACSFKGVCVIACNLKLDS